MPVTKTYSAEQPASVMAAQHGPVTYLWLRRNIVQDWADNGPDSEPTPIWVADEVSAVLPYAIGEEEALERFDELWAELAAEELSSAEVASMLGDLTEAVLSMMGGE